ncbi:hypothetical protein IW262DRAFT_371639 [Armillaria fumosa]|nr:hypothetical protein IW262DRAFT_371639 [Armillaria fumosa]
MVFTPKWWTFNCAQLPRCTHILRLDFATLSSVRRRYTYGVAFDASQGCGIYSAPSKRYNSFLRALNSIIIILDIIGQYKTRHNFHCSTTTPLTIMRLSRAFACLATFLVLVPQAYAGPIAYGICQTATFGTVVAAPAAPAVILACNAALGTCSATCATVALFAPTP